MNTSPSTSTSSQPPPVLIPIVVSSSTRTHGTPPPFLRRRSHSPSNRRGKKKNYPSSSTSHSYASLNINVSEAPETKDKSLSVFLGGSCNPTTWRTRLAIPLLDQYGLTYYNPQVEEWYEELVAEETFAKTHARCILMVIDKKTRAIVSMNEAIEYMVGKNNINQVVLVVVQDFEQDVENTKSTNDDLAIARSLVKELAKKNNIPCFNTILDALQAILKWFECTPWEFDNSSENSTICNVSNVSRAVEKELSKKLQKTTTLSPTRRLRKRSSIVLESWCQQIKPQFSRANSASSIWKATETTQPVTVGPSSKACIALCGKSSPLPTKKELVVKDWRTNIAIPLLTQAGIPYAVSEKSTFDEREEFTCDTLLIFVVDKSSSHITTMTQAIRVITSRERAIILVVETIPEDEPQASSGSEIKDLNRARSYLRETAKRYDVDVYDNVREVFVHIIDRLHHNL